ncbi:MAG: hypothetical protein C4534_10610 [Gaiellales bacterium]|nr:MAG: hypothetical protein C4534_10610 [Gaiellales bacterium]
MGYTLVALEDKLMEMYPEISASGIHLSLSFDEERDAWVINFEKSGHTRYAFLDRKDADACMDGTQCIYLGVLVEQYIRDLENEIAGK